MSTQKLMAAIATLGTLFALALSSNQARAEVLNFDDLEIYDPEWEEPVDSYGGLDWTNAWVIDGAGYAPGTGTEVGVVSGNNVITNGYGEVSSASGTEKFTFNGAFLTSAYNEGLVVTVTGYSDGVAVGSATVTLSTTQQTALVANFENVDTVQFIASGGVDVDPNDYFAGTNFVLDNFRINEPVAPTAVPELSADGLGSTSLLLAGLAAVFAGRRRHDTPARSRRDL